MSKQLLSAYFQLIKPRIIAMVLVTAALGFYLGGQGFHDPLGLFLTLLGVGLGSGGSAVLNNYLECDFDARMDRTRHRAIPSGLVPAAHALVMGTLMVLAGVLLLAFTINILASFLVLLAAFLYVLVYTPMKRLTWFNTNVGAIPGAIPPMAGWAAATGHIDEGAWALFAILFLWQHPHFYAIAWMFRDDYRKGGFRMLPPNDPHGARAFRHALLYSLLLMAVSTLPTLLGFTGTIYLVGAMVLGLGMSLYGGRLLRSGSVTAARHLLRASVIYLPVWLLLTVVDLTF